MNKEVIIITREIESPDIRNQIWEIYKQSFDGSEIRCAQNQKCYDEKSFKNALMDPDYFKYYLEINGKIMAYMLATNNLQKASITYMNPERYCAIFREYAPDRIYYFTSLAVAKNNSLRYFYKLIAEGLKHIAGQNGIWAFDFAHETVSNLANAFISIAKKLYRNGQLPYDLAYIKVGAQEFGALKPNNKKSAG